MKFKLKYKPKSSSDIANHRDITKKDPKVVLFL